MPQLRHIAISTKNSGAAAKFFTSAFSVKGGWVIDNGNASGCYVSDGHINFTIQLRYKTDGAADGEYGKGYGDLHHRRFRVEDIPSENPTTGRLTALSILRSIQQAVAPIRIGT